MSQNFLWRAFGTSWMYWKVVLPRVLASSLMETGSLAGPAVSSVLRVTSTILSRRYECFSVRPNGLANAIFSMSRNPCESMFTRMILSMSEEYCERLRLKFFSI